MKLARVYHRIHPGDVRQVKWSTFEELVPTMVGFKRDVYERLEKIATPKIEAHCSQRV
ncbi:hypothetical protein T484DRAFT_1845789 [Baffinella frigidus]|nr:hypothetical protein T484DRAFT_1845789 [Cryptophyta sp. CCMP2293]